MEKKKKKETQTVKDTKLAAFGKKKKKNPLFS